MRQRCERFFLPAIPRIRPFLTRRRYIPEPRVVAQPRTLGPSCLRPFTPKALYKTLGQFYRSLFNTFGVSVFGASLPRVRPDDVGTTLGFGV